MFLVDWRLIIIAFPLINEADSIEKEPDPPQGPQLVQVTLGSKEHLKSIENFQPTKENILEKLLQHSGAPKKAAAEGEEKKYNPKFEKRDYETIAQQNMGLKQELQQEREVVGAMKFRLGEAERKVKFLEGMQEKLARGVEEQEEGKKQPVYTEILKKKIQELN